LAGWGAQVPQRVFYQVVAAVVEHGLDSLSESNVYERATRGLLVQLGDPYSELFSPEDLASFSRATLRDSYGGLGIVISAVRDTVTVTRVFDGSPADAADVRPGDRVVRVGGLDVGARTIEEVSALLIGREGTTVDVAFARPGQPMREKRFLRRQVNAPAVPFFLRLDHGIGYIPLATFGDASASEVERALTALAASGAASFILDLRANGGGRLDQAIRISEMFLAAGQTVLRTEFRGNPDEIVVAKGRQFMPGALLVVLVDEGSASAAEIVAGALQDHDRAVVIGATSYGKGLVQDLFPLEAGWALKLTTGRWYTPSGRTIERPRRLLVDGSVQEVAREGEAPVFRSDGGRILYGGGGITPDIAVGRDTLSAADEKLFVFLVPHRRVLGEALTEMAVDRLPLPAGGFLPSAGDRADLLQRLASRGVHPSADVWEPATAAIDRLIERSVLELGAGEAAVFLRERESDPQLRAAVSLLQGARTQRAVLERVSGLPFGS
jgi:carboxyl-terminal processing protease